MADIADVMDELEFISVAAVYPDGPLSPSVTGKVVSVGQGWPRPTDVDTNIDAGDTVVSIYSEQSSTSPANTPINSFFTSVEASPGVVVSESEGVYTLSGIPKVGDVVVVSTQGEISSYTVSAGDTLPIVATALVDLAGAVLASNGTLSFPQLAVVRVSSVGMLAEKIHRQRVQFQINVWSPSAAHRAAVAIAIDIALKSQVRYQMPDNTSMIVAYQGTNLDDKNERQGVYRRILIFNVTYDTIRLSEARTVALVSFSKGEPQ